MPRGGPRHVKKPYVDPGVLLKCLEKHKRLVEDLGPYEVLSQQSASDFVGLVKLAPLWRDVLQIEATGMLAPQPLRRALGALLVAEPHLNSTTEATGGMWVNLKVERLTVLLFHVRRLGREQQQLLPMAAQKLTRRHYEYLVDGLEKLQLETLEEIPLPTYSPGKRVRGKTSVEQLGLEKSAEKKIKKEPLEEQVLEKSAVHSEKKLQVLEKSGEKKAKREQMEEEKCAKLNDLGKASSASRQLVQHESNVSMDSSGVPKLFGLSPSPKKELEQGQAEKPLEKGKCKEEDQDGASVKSEILSLQRPGQRLREAMRLGGSPALGKAKGKAGAKKNTQLVAPQGRQPWKRLVVCHPRNPPRTYIQGCVEGGKLHLIVEVSRTMSSRHEAICHKIKDALEKDSLTKAEALELRKQLLEEERAG